MMYYPAHVPKTNSILFQVNLRSSPGAFNSLENLIAESRPLIVAVSDPPKRLRKNPNLRTRDYQWISCSMDEAWTGLMIRRDADRAIIGLPTQYTVALTVNTPRGIIGCISFYLKPDNSEKAMQELDEAISQMKTRTDKYFIMGDSNAHSNLWSPVTSSNELGIKVEEMICAHSLMVVNAKDSPPTFFDSRGNGHWIDITLTTVAGSTLVKSWGVRQNSIDESDHECLATELCLAAQASMQRLVKDWKKTDWETYREVLQDKLKAIETDIESKLDSKERIEEAVSSITGAINEVTRTLVPVKKLKWNANGWFDSEMKTLNYEYKECRRIWRRTKTNEDKAKLEAARSLFRKRCRDKKRESFYRFCESLDKESMWNGLKRVSGSRSPTSIEYLTVNSELVSTELGIAQALADKYFGLHQGNQTSPTLQRAEDEYRKWRDNLQQEETDFEGFTKEEVEDELKRGRRETAPGLDSIPNQVLKVMASCLAPAVQQIFNACLRLGFFPSKWKESLVINIRKPGADSKAPKGYRPISLLSTLGKKFESLLNARLKRHMEANNAWNSRQFGFRARKCTMKALWRLTQFAHRSFNKKRQTAAISFDIQGAFDNLNPTLLWYRLYQAGLPNETLRPITDFLSNRSAHIQVRNGAYRFGTQRGVPQGSPLSPSLFLTYIDSVLNSMKGAVQGQLFADDLIIYTGDEMAGDT